MNNFYVNVKSLMIKQGLIDLPRPRLKPKILVTGWNEWLPIITMETET